MSAPVELSLAEAVANFIKKFGQFDGGLARVKLLAFASTLAMIVKAVDAGCGN